MKAAESSKLTPLSHGAQNHCFGCGQANRTGMRLKFFVDEQQRVVCHFKVPRRFEGPPGTFTAASLRPFWMKR